MLKQVICPRCWTSQHPYCDKCENAGELYDVKLSKNFFLSEFTNSPTANKHGISNDATIAQQDRLMGFCKNLLQPLRNIVGPIKITSGLRSPELNKLVGGSPDSAHLHAYASDCQFERATLNTVMYTLKQHEEIKFDQAIIECGTREGVSNDDWLHLGWKRASGIQRRQFLVMRNGIYSPYVFK